MGEKKILLIQQEFRRRPKSGEDLDLSAAEKDKLLGRTRGKQVVATGSVKNGGQSNINVNPEAPESFTGNGS